jgi:hypothetical protein
MPFVKQRSWRKPDSAPLSTVRLSLSILPRNEELVDSAFQEATDGIKRERQNQHPKRASLFDGERHRLDE